jgi:hypothetical protein
MFLPKSSSSFWRIGKCKSVRKQREKERGREREREGEREGERVKESKIKINFLFKTYCPIKVRSVEFYASA